MTPKDEAKFIVGTLISIIALLVFVFALTCPWVERRTWRKPWHSANQRVVYRVNNIQVS